jgi:hypothetical protein
LCKRFELLRAGFHRYIASKCIEVLLILVGLLLGRQYVRVQKFPQLYNYGIIVQTVQLTSKLKGSQRIVFYTVLGIDWRKNTPFAGCHDEFPVKSLFKHRFVNCDPAVSGVQLQVTAPHVRERELPDPPGKITEQYGEDGEEDRQASEQQGENALICLVGH